jgi:hypothetical protein
LFYFFYVYGTDGPSSVASNYTWPTIAPSSIDFYDMMYIPGWKNSLLVTSLKLGLYRLKLKTTGNFIDSSSTPQIIDTIAYLHEYRVRDIAIAPSGDTIFLAIDSTGSTSGPTGGFSGAQTATKTPGHILRMVFLETLPIVENPVPEKAVNNREAMLVYPNPASTTVHVLCKSGMRKPLLVQLYDISGRMVMQETQEQDQFQINVSQYRAGVYVLRIYNGNQINITTQKIVIRPGN